MKAAIIVVGLVILIVVSGGIYLLNQPIDNQVSKPGEDVEKIIIGDSETLSPEAIGESGSYQEFSQGSFERSSNLKRVLYFYANWCPVCKPADAEFKSNMSKLPKGLILFRINYNDSDTDQTEKDFAKKYGITYQHTFVQIDKDGQEITKWNGGAIDKLLSSIK